MARGMYVVGWENQTIAAASGDYDYVELTPADDKPIEIVSFHLSNLTEIGDAQEEQIRLAIVRGNTTSGNGSALTPVALDPSDGSASFSAEGPSSTPASTAGTTMHPFGWNLRVPLDYFFPPEERIKTSQAQTMICIRQLSTLTDDVNMSFAVYVREV